MGTAASSTADATLPKTSSTGAPARCSSNAASARCSSQTLPTATSASGGGGGASPLTPATRRRRQFKSIASRTGPMPSEADSDFPFVDFELSDTATTLTSEREIQLDHSLSIHGMSRTSRSINNNSNKSIVDDGAIDARGQRPPTAHGPTVLRGTEDGGGCGRQRRDAPQDASGSSSSSSSSTSSDLAEQHRLRLSPGGHHHHPLLPLIPSQPALA